MTSETYKGRKITVRTVRDRCYGKRVQVTVNGENHSYPLSTEAEARAQTHRDIDAIDADTRPGAPYGPYWYAVDDPRHYDSEQVKNDRRRDANSKARDYVRKGKANWRWTLSSVAELPELSGPRGKVRIVATENGDAYEVTLYRDGKKVDAATRKSLVTAFKAGEKLAGIAESK